MSHTYIQKSVVVNTPPCPAPVPKKKTFKDKFDDELVLMCLWLFYIVAFLGVIPATLKATAVVWQWWWHL